MNVFATAEKHMSWLATRHAITSNNMANVDTPGYRARDAVPFGKEMQYAATRLATSNKVHLQAFNQLPTEVTSRLQNNEEVTLSGNDVVMEREMRTAGENARLYSFDIGLLKSFHRMLLSSVKG
jgi:flagellar basal-body rod protein FlgB